MLHFFLVQWTVTGHRGLIGHHVMLHVKRVYRYEQGPVPILHQNMAVDYVLGIPLTLNCASLIPVPVCYVNIIKSYHHQKVCNYYVDRTTFTLFLSLLSLF